MWMGQWVVKVVVVVCDWEHQIFVVILEPPTCHTQIYTSAVTTNNHTHPYLPTTKRMRMGMQLVRLVAYCCSLPWEETSYSASGAMKVFLHIALEIIIGTNFKY